MFIPFDIFEIGIQFNSHISINVLFWRDFVRTMLWGLGVPISVWQILLQGIGLKQRYGAVYSVTFYMCELVNLNSTNNVKIYQKVANIYILNMSVWYVLQNACCRR